MHHAKQIGCLIAAIILSISSIHSQIIQRDTLHEDFSSAEWTRYTTYTSAVLTTQNNITWHFENMQVAQVGKLTSTGLVYYYNATRTFGRLTTSKIRGLHKITFDVASNQSCSFTVSYSKTGQSKEWTECTRYAQTTGMRKDSIILPETGDYYIKFYIGGYTGRYLYLDDITFYTEETNPDYGEPMDIVDWTDHSLTLNMNGCAPKQGVLVGLNDSTQQSVAEGNRYSFSGQNDRTYCISTPALQSGEDLQLSVQYGDNQGNKYESDRHYRIPYLYQNTTVSKLSFLPDDDIVVRSGKTTIEADVAVRNVYVYPDGELIVNDKCTLLCANLYLRTTATQSAAASGQIKAHRTYYTRIVADKTHYFQLALPAKSPVQKVVTTAGDTCRLDKHWRLNTYDTQLRAENGIASTNWVRYTGDTLQACQGYAMLSASPYYREYLFPITYPKNNTTASLIVPATAPKGDIDTRHDGWNYLCSPYPSLYVSATTDNMANHIYISELRSDGGSYWQHIADTIYPAKPFYYQSATTGNLVFGETLHFESSVNQSVAAQSIQSDNTSEINTQWLQLLLIDTLGRTDETHIYLHPTRFSADYQIGKDLLKLRGTGNYPLLYSIMPYGELSFCAVSDTTAERQIRLGCFFPADGTHTHTLRLQDNACLERLAEVLLVDHQTDTQIDLLQQDYTFSAQTGESADRFALRCIFQPKATPTRIDSDNRAGVAVKTVQNGQLFIIRHNGVYDVLGRQVHR